MGRHVLWAPLGANAVFPGIKQNKSIFIKALQRQFKFVGVPPSDPGKLDFGDLDIME